MGDKKYRAVAALTALLCRRRRGRTAKAPDEGGGSTSRAWVINMMVVTFAWCLMVLSVEKCMVCFTHEDYILLVEFLRASTNSYMRIKQPNAPPCLQCKNDITKASVIVSFHPRYAVLLNKIYNEVSSASITLASHLTAFRFCGPGVVIESTRVSNRSRGYTIYMNMCTFMCTLPWKNSLRCTQIEINKFGWILWDVELSWCLVGAVLKQRRSMTDLSIVSLSYMHLINWCAGAAQPPVCQLPHYCKSELISITKSLQLCSNRNRETCAMHLASAGNQLTPSNLILSRSVGPRTLAYEFSTIPRTVTPSVVDKQWIVSLKQLLWFAASTARRPNIHAEPRISLYLNKFEWKWQWFGFEQAKLHSIWDCILCEPCIAFVANHLYFCSHSRVRSVRTADYVVRELFRACILSSSPDEYSIEDTREPNKEGNNSPLILHFAG